MKAGLYIRVSSDRQAKEGESLAEQEATLQAYCNFRDIAITAIYKEEGRSGKDTNRPQFQRMIKDCQLGKIDTVIVKKVDRLSRSLIDFEKTIKFFEDNNVNLISLNENFDTSTAIGRAVIRIILTFAQLEREQTSERTVDVMKFRAEQGQWNGGYPPLGYNYDKELGLIINTEEAKIVEIIFDKYIELASYRKVAEFLNTAGHRTKKFINRLGQEIGGEKFIDTYIARVLKHPVYIGKIKYKDQSYNGKHQPIITGEQFNKAQEIIEKNTVRNTSVKKANTHNFTLEGLLRCGECGSIMTPKWSVSSTGQRYFYYSCTSVEHNGANTCTIKGVNALSFEQLILSRIRTLSSDEYLLQNMVSQNDQDIKKEIGELEDKRILLKMRAKEVEEIGSGLVSKMSQLPDLQKISFVTDELSKLETEKESLKKETEQMEFKINQLKNRIINKDLLRESMQRFNRIYHELTTDLKKFLIKLLIKDITFNKTIITINFFESNDICVFAESGGAGASLAAPINWLPEDMAKPNCTDRFNVTTCRGERGKLYYRLEASLN